MSPECTSIVQAPPLSDQTDAFRQYHSLFANKCRDDAAKAVAFRVIHEVGKQERDIGKSVRNKQNSVSYFNLLNGCCSLVW